MTEEENLMILFIFIVALLVIPITTQVRFENYNAEGIILMNPNTGEILYSKNEDKMLYPASTTKVMTALLVMEHGNLQDIVTVGREISIIAKDSSTAGLIIGQKISVEDLIESLILSSGNDSANTLAVYISRKTGMNPGMDIERGLEEFNNRMNIRAGELGASNTHFTNPHGYHDNNHYSTAYDLTIITLEAMKHSYFEELVKKPKGGKWKNRNLLVDSDNPHYYPYATGLKTGYTPEAGYCLISSASKEDIDLLAVVLNSSKEGRWVLSKQLLEDGFNLLLQYTHQKRNAS